MTRCLLLVTATLASCWKQSPPPAPQPTPTGSGEVDVQVAAVTLGNQDCPAVEAEQQSRAGKMRSPDCAPPSMQLSLKAGDRSATIHIKRVDIVDTSGARLDTLTSREPTVWTDVGTYKQWDESIAANEAMAVSYALSTPKWDRFMGGRFGEQTFKVRVTVAIGSVDKVYEKQVKAMAAIEPMIET
jgi:hypothetical protein